MPKKTSKHVFNLADIEGCRVRYMLRLYHPDMDKGEIMYPFVMPRTKAITQWLKEKGWGKFPSRVVDNYVKRYWEIYIGKEPGTKDKSTRWYMEDMLNRIENNQSLPYFCNANLLRRPTFGRLLDYLSAFWYVYERGKKRKLFGPIVKKNPNRTKASYRRKSSRKC